MMKKLLLSLAFSVALATSAMAAKVGDQVGVQFVCATKEDAFDVASADKAAIQDVATEKIESGKCMVLPTMVEVTLETEYKISTTASVFKIKEAELYVLGHPTETDS